MATLLAAAQPELCRSLVLYTLTAGHTMAAGLPLESIDEAVAMIEADALSGDSGVEMLAPSRVGDERFDARWPASSASRSGRAPSGTTTGRRWRPTSPTSCP